MTLNQRKGLVLKSREGLDCLARGSHLICMDLRVKWNLSISLSFQPQALQYVCNNKILKEQNRQERVTKGRNIAAVIGGDSQAVSAEGRVVWTGLADITLSHVAHPTLLHSLPTRFHREVLLHHHPPPRCILGSDYKTQAVTGWAPLGQLLRAPSLILFERKSLRKREKVA